MIKCCFSAVFASIATSRPARYRVSCITPAYWVEFRYFRAAILTDTIKTGDYGRIKIMMPSLGEIIWPGILVPIVVFFGLTVWLALSVTGDAVKNIEKK
jgi:hypothetical protein